MSNITPYTGDNDDSSPEPQVTSGDDTNTRLGDGPFARAATRLPVIGPHLAVLPPAARVMSAVAIILTVAYVPYGGVYSVAVAAFFAWAGSTISKRLAASRVTKGNAVTTTVGGPIVVGTPGDHATALARSAAQPHIVSQLLSFAAVGFTAVSLVGAVTSAAVIEAVGLVAFLVWAAIGYLFHSHGTAGSSDKVGRALAGASAERTVAQAVADVKGLSYLLNGQLIGAGGDVDHIIVGPCLAVIETKSGGGPLSVRGGKVQAGSKTISGDPLEQVLRQATHLSTLTNLPVTPIVCVPGGRGTVLADGGVLICGVRDLPTVLTELPAVMNPGDAKAIAAHIEGTHRAEVQRRQRR